MKGTFFVLIAKLKLAVNNQNKQGDGCGGGGGVVVVVWWWWWCVCVGWGVGLDAILC